MPESTRLQQELVPAILAKLDKIVNNTKSSACCAAVTSAGSNSSIPAGFASASIVLLSGSISVTMSDSSVYPMTIANESLLLAAPQNKTLPAITISGGGTWKWNAIK